MPETQSCLLSEKSQIRPKSQFLSEPTGTTPLKVRFSNCVPKLLIFYSNPSHFQIILIVKQQFWEFEVACTQGETILYNATNRIFFNKNKNFPLVFFGRKIFENFRKSKNPKFYNVDPIIKFSDFSIFLKKRLFGYFRFFQKKISPKNIFRPKKNSSGKFLFLLKFFAFVALYEIVSPYAQATSKSQNYYLSATIFEKCDGLQ